MRAKKHIVKVMALVILLVFTQKIGLGLYIHNQIHPATSHSFPTDGPISEKASNLNCSCIDDFLLPFTEPSNENIVPANFHTTAFISFYEADIRQVSHYFSSLRGPPTAQS
ncbi:MAG TPA: hypothetical protein VLJ68_02990 [Chitinophagaceae bacterium]|nr:hypothetical protein [Chitinophagaceae bacterium]